MRCYKGGNHHCFRPRYTEIEEANPLLQRGFELKGICVESLIKMLTIKKIIYIRDVCIWCGKTIENKQKEEQNDD